MKQIGRDEGVRLMRQWGVTNWPDVEADYQLWGGCCVFALMQGDGFSDIHMAMDKRHRVRARAALTDAVQMLKNAGVRTVRAMIEAQYRRACNVAARVGFEHCGMIVGERLDGTITEVIEMRIKL